MKKYGLNKVTDVLILHMTHIHMLQALVTLGVWIENYGRHPHVHALVR